MNGNYYHNRDRDHNQNHYEQNGNRNGEIRPPVRRHERYVHHSQISAPANDSIIDWLLHFTLLIVQLIWWLASAAAEIAQSHYHRFASLYVFANESTIAARLAALRNIPTDVAIGVNHDRFDTSQIAQIIDWCRSVPTIRTLTIYHPYSCRDEHRIETGKLAELNNRICCATEDQNRQIEISFLPFEAGRSSVIEAAKHFATRMIANGSENKKEIEIETISEHLRRHDYPNPDPQLLLLFGDCQIYCGFPAWQIRLSETVFMPPLDTITFSRFYRALELYSKCEQRFGK